jgi:hypothetical protein
VLQQWTQKKIKILPKHFVSMARLFSQYSISGEKEEQEL